MLVLSRKLGERILIGQDIVVTVLRASGQQIRLGISAPAGMRIHREEVMADERQGLEALSPGEPTEHLSDCA